ncbi:MAG: SIMPL domain-containing protein [Hyphomicrobiales bacterium]
MTFRLFKNSFLPALTLITSIALTGLGLTDANAHDKMPAKFSILGTGTIVTEPDVAFISTGVVSKGKTAEKALSKNSNSMANIFKVLEDAGIERKHIQTSNFSVQPRYVHHRPNKGEERRPPRIVGYEVNNTVTVKIVELDNTGKVISEVVKFGSNSLGNIRFDVSNRQELMDEARVKAVKDARRKAEIYTKAAGISLGKVLAISEGRAAQQPRRFKAAARSLAVAEAAPAPVSGGEASISVQVNMTWELEQ